MALLAKYGGVWSDSTVFVTKPIKGYDLPFYSIRQHCSNPRYVDNGNGWTAYFIATCPNSIVAETIYKFFIAYWKTHDVLIDYYLVDYAITLFNNIHNDIIMGKIKDFIHFIIHLKSYTLSIKGNNNTAIQAENVYESYSIIPMTDFLSTWKSKSDYIQFPNFEQLKKDIITQDGTTIRFLGLSGLGKSRLIYEIFSSIDNANNYYCSNASDVRLCNDLLTTLSKNKDVSGFIVLDNCDTQSFISLMSTVRNVISKFKIIAIHNDPSEKASTSGVNVVRLQRSDLKKSVDNFIDDRLKRMSCDDASIHEQIRNMADGFPQIAINAIEEYQKMHEPQLINDEQLWKKMCGSIINNNDNAVALQSLALFDPLGYEDEVGGDYAFVKYNVDITPLYEMNDQHKDSIFYKVVSSLKERELVEQTASWIVVRPLPLAVWLVGQWFENCDAERFSRVINDLESETDKNMATRITRAFCKRLVNMQDNKNAVVMFKRLMREDGPFANEEVVCSDIGSRLFLAISTVNPASVTDCLYNVINSKTTEWLKENVKHDARRNLIWCLEHLCFPAETFERGAWILAKLSLAENETWGNNATGIFEQLFHVELPGTSASLKQRLNVIKKLSESGKEFTPILLGALNRAFDYGSFTRSGGGEKFGLKTLTDFRPTGLEIIEYWNGCKDVVKEVISKNKDCIDDIKKIVYDHSYALGPSSGCWDILFGLIEDIQAVDNSSWPEMGKRLYSLKIDGYPLSDKDKGKLDKLIDKLSDHTFVTTLSKASYKYSHDEQYKRSLLDDRIKNAPTFWKQYVDKFIDDSIYEDEKAINQLLDFKEIDYIFVKTLAQALDEGKAKALSETIKLIIKDKKSEYESDFINIFFGIEPNKFIFNDFCEYLLHTRHFVQYVDLMSPKETKELKVLNTLLVTIKQYDLPLVDTLKIYFSRAPLYDEQQMAATCDIIKNAVADASALLLYYIIGHHYSGLIFKEPMYEKTKSLLLDYNPQNENYIGFREINDLLGDILRECNDPEFAKSYNKKIIEGTGDFRTFLKYKNLYDGIYFDILPKYQDAVLEDVLSALSNPNLAFYLNFRFDLGSGSSMGRGPLFLCSIDKIKAKCIEEREGDLPSKLASMCPVFYYSDVEKHYEDRFSDFFYWLIDNFEEFTQKKEILASFHSNMGTYSWSGSVIPLLKRKQKAFLTLRKKTNDKMILQWIKNSLSLLEKEINRESKNEVYENLI